LPNIIEKIAKLKEVTVTTVTRAIYKNTLKVFKVKSIKKLFCMYKNDATK
jgi:hypothetical protein